MMQVSTYIASTLADFGVRHVFMLTGGGAMHLNDAFGLENRIQVICNHHEQACAITCNLDVSTPDVLFQGFGLNGSLPEHYYHPLASSIDPGGYSTSRFAQSGLYLRMKR
jgi:hypothetical protein